MDQFKYCDTTDTYICPQNQILRTNGIWQKSKSSPFKQYKTNKNCLSRTLCTKATKNGKIIQRSLYTVYINKNKERIENQKDYYRKRQAIVEHPYGTIKRQWGFHYIITKKYKHRAEADSGFMIISYNFRRIINLLGLEAVKNYLNQLCQHFEFMHHQILVHSKLYMASLYFLKYAIRFHYRSLKGLIFGQNIGFSLGF